MSKFIFVYFYLGFSILRPHEYIAGLQSLRIMPVLLAGGVAFWLFNARKKPSIPQHMLLPLLLVVMVISQALTGWIGGIQPLVSGFYPIILMYFLVSDALDNNKKMHAVFFLIIISAVVMSIHGIYQASDINGMGWSGALLVMNRITYVGIFSDPNDLGLMFVMSLPLIAYFYYNSRSFMFKLVLLGMLAIVVQGMILTQSRGTILGAGALIGLHIALRYGVIKAAMLGVVGLIGLLGASSRISQIDANEASAAGRIEAWYEGLQMLKNHLLFGVSPNGFLDHHYRTAHNSFVLSFAELGLVGYFVWLSFCALSLYMMYLIMMAPSKPPLKEAVEQPDNDKFCATENAFSLVKSNSEQDWQQDQKIAKAILFSTIGFFAASFFLSRSYTLLLYLLCGISVAHYLNVLSRWPEFPRLKFSDHWGKLVLLCIASILFFFILVRLLLSL